MKRYIRASEENDHYPMLKSQIQKYYGKYYADVLSKSEDPVYWDAVGFITDAIMKDLKSITEDEVESEVRNYLDGRYSFDK